MEARSSADLPAGTGWRFEPKWDGFRCLAGKHGKRIELTAKSGKPLARYFPEIVDVLGQLPAARFLVDGELLVGSASAWSFKDLQARLHPAASRINRLAAETPATLMLFDMLETGGEDLQGQPLSTRRSHLEDFVRRNPHKRLALTPGTTSRAAATRWLSDGLYEGVVAKRLDGPYLAGERAMVKVKRQRTADCVVGGFRYASSGNMVGSLLLGLYDDTGRLNHVGFTSGFAEIDRKALTSRLEKLRGGEGFSGRAPGAPSRWTTDRSAEWVRLKPKMVVEVSFDHVSEARFRHGARLLRFRPDKAPRQCRMEQIE